MFGLDPDGNVWFLQRSGGQITKIDKIKPVELLLWRADALVLLSNAEGLPQVLIQAAAAGLPFVTALRILLGRASADDASLVVLDVNS